jgi:hypothetical protein
MRSLVYGGNTYIQVLRIRAEMPPLWQPPDRKKSMDSVLMKPVKLQAGDVIFIDRVFYRHYGIYAGKGRVIHYSGENSHFGKDVGVRETSLEQFAGGEKCTVVQFTENRSGIKLFSGKETVNRARSRLGEERYNLLFNNCEHFALWCKTGRSKSIQVEKTVAAAVMLGTIAVTALLVELDEGA